VEGFTLNRGFAVFIDEYPESKAIFQYDGLKLAPFQPGALIKTRNGLARVADPIRQPTRLLDAIKSPVGKISDKLRLIPLLFHVKSKSISELFEETETDVDTCLREKYKFSDKMIREFFQPFFEGIFFCPLNQQSSRMFHFVFKMFSQGSATLPTDGMQTVADQLCNRAKEKGVDVRLDCRISRLQKQSNGLFRVITANGEEMEAKSVVCATEGSVARQLLSTLPELKVLSTMEDQPERSVGCMYYKFSEDPPIKEAILILNGESPLDGSGSINNVCFPSVVNPTYAPSGYHLCSVAIDDAMMKKYEDNEKELDQMIRQNLGEYFPEYKDSIQSKWDLLRTYRIHHAQPAQLNGPMPANVYGGRPCDMYRDISLPSGLFVAGDYTNTASLNGALESGKLAANAVMKYIGK
jgi:phytoene dehydrogenase-like protein